ncbi:hypothetical protein D3C78_1380550 [compost metagenome]
MHDGIGDGGDLRHAGHLHAGLHGTVGRLHADLHGARLNLGDLRLGAALLEVQLAQLQLGAGLRQGLLDRLLNALLDLLRALLFGSGADRFHHVAFKRYVHKPDHERQHGGLVLRRQRLDGLAHRVQLLAAVAGGARYVLQGNLQAGAQQVVGQIAVAVHWVDLRQV